MTLEENYYINGNFTYAVSVTNYVGPVYRIEPIHSYFSSRFDKEEFNKRDIGGHLVLHPEEKNILKDYLKMVDENIESILEHNLFPIFAIEDVLEDKELFKDLEIFNLSCNLVGKNVLFSNFGHQKFNVNLYYLLHIDRDIAELMVFYILTREYDKGIEYSYKALSHFNKSALFNALVGTRVIYDIDKKTAKEISKYIADNIDIIKTDMTKEILDRVVEFIGSVVVKNKCKRKNTVKETTNKNEKKSTKTAEKETVEIEYKPDLMKEVNKKIEISDKIAKIFKDMKTTPDSKKEETVIDTVETVSKDGKLTYEPVESEKNKSNSNTILDNLPDYENIADYVLNKDFRIFNGVDKLTGVKKVSFFNYFQLNSLKKNIKFYRMVELAIIAILESGALKRVFKEYTKNPFFKFDIEASELKDGIVGISVLDTEAILIVEFEKNRKDVKDVKLCKSTGTIDIKEEVC